MFLEYCVKTAIKGYYPARYALNEKEDEDGKANTDPL